MMLDEKPTMSHKGLNGNFRVWRLTKIPFVYQFRIDVNKVIIRIYPFQWNLLNRSLVRMGDLRIKHQPASTDLPNRFR